MLERFLGERQGEQVEELVTAAAAPTEMVADDCRLDPLDQRGQCI